MDKTSHNASDLDARPGLARRIVDEFLFRAARWREHPPAVRQTTARNSSPHPGPCRPARTWGPQ